MKKIKPEQLKGPVLRDKLREYRAMGLNVEQIRELLGLPSQGEILESMIKKIMREVFGADNQR